MSIEYKAKVYYGYELKENWNENISDETFEKYVDYFRCTESGNKDYSLFATDVDYVEEGDYTELSLTVYEDELHKLLEFAKKYSEILEGSPKYFLVCEVD